jgi:hypothetical protein
MFALIGILVVFGEVVGGYLMEHGNLKVRLQPAELRSPLTWRRSRTMNPPITT